MRQLAVSVVPATALSVHAGGGPALNGLPVAAAKVAFALLAQFTLPVGLLRVPASVSTTVAVHVAAVPTLTGLGAQLTWLVVARLLTVSVVEPLLARYVPVVVKAPVICSDPILFGTKSA